MRDTGVSATSVSVTLAAGRQRGSLEAMGRGGCLTVSVSVSLLTNVPAGLGLASLSACLRVSLRERACQPA